MSMQCGLYQCELLYLLTLLLPDFTACYPNLLRMVYPTSLTNRNADPNNKSNKKCLRLIFNGLDLLAASSVLTVYV